MKKNMLAGEIEDSEKHDELKAHFNKFKYRLVPMVMTKEMDDFEALKERLFGKGYLDCMVYLGNRAVVYRIRGGGKVSAVLLNGRKTTPLTESDAMKFIEETEIDGVIKEITLFFGVDFRNPDNITYTVMSRTDVQSLCTLMDGR